MVLDPLKVLTNFGVDSKLLLSSTALTPAHQSYQKPSILIFSEHRASTVPTAGIFPVPQAASTQHVVRDRGAHGLGTLIVGHDGDLDVPEGSSEAVVMLACAAPARHHHLLPTPHQLLLSQVAGGKADWEGVFVIHHMLSQVQHGYVIV